MIIFKWEKLLPSRSVPHMLKTFQKAERVRITRETLEILNKGGGHGILSKGITGDETYIPFFDIPTCHDSGVWIHDDSATPTKAKKQSAV